MTSERGCLCRQDYRIVVVDDHTLFRESCSGARTVLSKREPLRRCLSVVRRLQQEAA